MEFILGAAIGFLLGFKLCAHFEQKHLERTKQIRRVR